MIVDGRIQALNPEQVPDDAERIDGGGRLLTPGLIDIHTHGIEEYLYESGPDALLSGLTRLPQYGVTCVFPTLYRVMGRASLPQLEALAAALDGHDGVRVPGFHLEGPFLALPGAGADTVPGDAELLESLLEAAKGRVAAMSISPDTPNVVPVIERLRRDDIQVLITHTRGSVEQTVAAIAAGARHATHFYDVFPLPPETDPGVRPAGVVETVLAADDVSVDFIADGVHVHPMAIRAALKAKGPEKVLLITDSNIGAGLPAGVYETPWGFSVRVSPQEAARAHKPGKPGDGGLAGSALTMDVGMTNLLDWLDQPEADTWAMGTRSVAQRMGLTDLGDLTEGAAADLVLWDRKSTGQLQAERTWVAGRSIYDRKRQPEETVA